MKIRIYLLSAAVAAAIVAPVAHAQQEDATCPPDYITMPHMKGSLALQVSSISVLWYLPAGESKASRLRITSRHLSDAKVLGGADADAVWSSFRDRASEFFFVGHMGGTLAIPRAQLRTAYYSEDTGTPRLRLMYDGDTSGKTVEGEEATAIWDQVRR